MRIYLIHTEVYTISISLDIWKIISIFKKRCVSKDHLQYNIQMELVMLDHCEFGSFGFFLIFRQHLPRDFSFQYEQIEWFFTTTITVCSRKGTVVSRKGQQYNYKKGVSQVSGCPTSLLIEVLALWPELSK